MNIRPLLLAGALMLLFAPFSNAEVKVATELRTGTPAFRFTSVPTPANNDAANQAKFTIVDGDGDPNGGELAVLHDGRIPTGEDQPAENFFFRAGSDGGRLLLDLGHAIAVKQVSTYSWHTSTRAPQVYKLFASDGAADGFTAAPKRGIDTESCGWEHIASVDTRPKEGDGRGQHGVAVSDPASGILGKYRYLLFDISRTEDRDLFGNTFYSEIDVLDANGPAPTVATVSNREPVAKSFTAEAGKYHFTIDATDAPDLMEWADTKLRPVVQEWYPKLVAMLPSEGFEATTNVTLRFQTDLGGTPAAAGGGRISLRNDSTKSNARVGLARTKNAEATGENCRLIRSIDIASPAPTGQNSSHRSSKRTEPMKPFEDLNHFPLLQALRERRSRRFGLGMKIPGGPLAYESRHAPRPLSEEEIGALVFAGCGITGHALADLCYAKDGGGSIMAGLVARTIASGDGLQTVSLVVTNDEATYLIRKPRELPAADIPQLIELGKRGEFTELYRRCRVKLKDGRARTPSEPLFNINANRWSAHAPGTTYFLPVNDLTFMYVNGLLEILNEPTGAFILDERNHFLPAGLAKFARDRGGHLEGDPHKGRVATVRQVEQFVTEFVVVEQGMMLQNLGLMAEALGLGGFPNFANHEFAWFQALDFRMQEMPASRYVGAGWLPSLMMKLLRRNPNIPYPVGLECDGEVLLKPFCPPYYNSMADAVRAVVELKYGAGGIFRSAGHGSAWAKHDSIVNEVPRVSEASVEATIAYCEYLWSRYGRFPVYMPPYRTVLGFQASHLDVNFYDKFYQAGALSETVRREFEGNASRQPGAS